MLDSMKSIRDLHNATPPVDDDACGFIHELKQVLQQFSGLLNSGLQEQSGHDAVLAALIVANYVRRNEIAPEDLPHCVAQVRQAHFDMTLVRMWYEPGMDVVPNRSVLEVPVVHIAQAHW